MSTRTPRSLAINALIKYVICYLKLNLFKVSNSKSNGEHVANVLFLLILWTCMSCRRETERELEQRRVTEWRLHWFQTWRLINRSFPLAAEEHTSNQTNMIPLNMSQRARKVRYLSSLRHFSIETDVFKVLEIAKAHSIPQPIERTPLKDVTSSQSSGIAWALNSVSFSLTCHLREFFYTKYSYFRFQELGEAKCRTCKESHRENNPV